MKLVCLLSCLIVVGGNHREGKKRSDAGQDPYETMTLADADGPSSALFGSCLSASRTVEAKIFSIEVTTEDALPTTTEYFRYVPSSWQMFVDPAWVSVTGRDPPVSSIADCAEAANSQAYPMFKYSGGSDCLVSNRSYGLNDETACEDEEQDAVFISRDISVGPCSGLTSVKVLQRPPDVYACITLHPGPFTFEQAESYCSSVFSLIYTGVDIESVKSVLRQQQETTGGKYNYLLSAKYDTTAGWLWKDYGNTPVDTTMMVGAPSTSEDDVMFFSGADDFKFDFVPKSGFMGGVLCMEPACC